MKTHKISTSPFIIFLTGASGAGKSTLVEHLQQELSSDNNVFLHFDSIGVPPEEEMIKQYGSSKAWQKAKTEEWVKKLIQYGQGKQYIIFEGQTEIDFIISAFKAEKYDNYAVVLLHCAPKQQDYRLAVERKQPELANATMINWSNFLNKQAVAHNVTVLDTTHMSVSGMVSWFKDTFSNLGFNGGFSKIFLSS